MMTDPNEQDMMQAMREAFEPAIDDAEASRRNRDDCERLEKLLAETESKYRAAPTPTQPTAEQLDVTQADRERIAIEWLQCALEGREKWLAKCQHEVAAFTAMNEPAFKDTFLLDWQDCAESAARRLEIYQTLTDIVRDRDEWREQHENLLSVRRSDLQATEARMSAAVEVLDEIAAQKLRVETSDYNPDDADWEGGFEECVKRARQAITAIRSQSNG